METELQGLRQARQAFPDELDKRRDAGTDRADVVTALQALDARAMRVPELCAEGWRVM